jgi:hypothetical protein
MTLANAIAIPTPALGDELNQTVTKSKSAMTKRIEKVFRRNRRKPVKIVLRSISA